jgi:UbiD family decarboxylase
MEQSLRAIFSIFKEQGYLQFIDMEVDPVYELSAFLYIKNQGPSLFFRNVKNYAIPLVGNLLNTSNKVALSLGIEEPQIQATCISSIKSGIKPEIVADGPVQEVVLNDYLDISRLLPVPTWFEKETNPYITAGVIVAKDPVTGHRNISIARLRVEGGNTLMAGIAPTHHLYQLLQKAHTQDRDLEIAIAIGNHPATLLASQMYVDLGHDEFNIAGGLLGEPLRLVHCLSVDLEVPAEAEIVLEGKLYAEKPIKESLVSEFHGFYENYGNGHTVRINTITHRREPIYQAILPGYAAEHILLGGIAIGATTCLALQRVIPTVRRVFITKGGMGRLHAIITMRNPKRSEAKRAIMMAMATTNLLKFIIVVDDDIDPENWHQVEWALGARMRAEKDIMIMPASMADRSDPQQRNLTVAKVGILAISDPGNEKPGDRFEFARPPEDVLKRVRLKLKDI